MVGVAEISGAVGGLKAALDIAKGLNATAGAVALNDAKIALQSAILDAQGALITAQEAQTANLKRIDHLEAEIVQLKTWDREKQRYELREISRGVFTYVLKTEVQGGEPVHCICASCYQHGQRSILQSDGGMWGVATLTCPKCKADIKALEKSPNYPFEPSPPYSPL
ncbi:MAG TPA: hypothetical protein VLM18_12190 [Croceibacterium sp.]|nr:hypothetical protein [Croceibacterium sp.]